MEMLRASVALELRRVPGVPQSVLHMLCASLPHLSREHPFQDAVCNMVRETLEQRMMDLRKQRDDADAIAQEAQSAQACLPSVRAEATVRRQALEQALGEQSKVAKHLQSIEKAQQQIELRKQGAFDEKKLLTTAIGNFYQPLKDGAFHGDCEEGYLEGKVIKLFEALTILKLDPGMKRRLRRALHRKPSVRSDAEIASVRHLGDELDHTVAMLELAELRAADTEDTQLSDARIALDHAKGQYYASARVAKETEDKLAHCTMLSQSLKRARKTASTAAAELQAFCEGPLMRFHQLHETFGTSEDADSSMPTLPLQAPGNWTSGKAS